MNNSFTYIKVFLVIIAVILSTYATNELLTIYWLGVTAYWILNIYKDIKEEE